MRGAVGDTEEMEMTEDKFAPVTPGEMLKAEFLAEYGLSQNYLAKAIGISPNALQRSSTTAGASRLTLR
jgi:plasmid maintenance system antidote protein VapI